MQMHACWQQQEQEQQPAYKGLLCMSVLGLRGGALVRGVNMDVELVCVQDAGETACGSGWCPCSRVHASALRLPLASLRTCPRRRPRTR